MKDLLMIRIRLCLIALFFLVASSATFGQLPLVDDAYVTNASGSVANTNNGSSPSLVVQTSGGYSYLKFDLTKIIPLNSANYPIQSNMVVKATLRLYVTAVTAGGTIDVFEVGGTWCEKNGESACPSGGGITYNNRPPDGVQIVGSGTTIASIPISTTVQPNSYTTGQYVTIDVTQAVKDWIDNGTGAGGHPNYGLVLKPSTGSSVSTTFESKESTVTSHDPQLSIVLSGPQGVQGPVGSMGAVGPAGPPGPQPTVTTGGGLLITGINANGSENLNLDASVAVTQAGNNTLTGSNTYKNTVDLSGASLTLPVQTVAIQPAGTCTTANAMQLWSAGAVGQQLYICRKDPSTLALSWTNANDQNAALNAVATEASRAQAAETTLGTSLNSEIGRAKSAENTLSTSINTESVARQAADIALNGSLITESQRATGAESTLTSNLNLEISRATTAEQGKADLLAPIQTVSVQPTGSCSTANAAQLWGSGTIGQQLYFCRQDPSTGALSWVSASDNSAIANDVATETARAQAAETTLTTNLANEITRAQNAESSLTTNLASESNRAKSAESSETSRATTAEDTLTSNLRNEVTRAQNVEGTLTTNLNTESTARQAADAALSSSVVAENQRATAAEASITASVTAETTRATAAENSKADLIAPVQAISNQPTGNCATANAVQLWSAGPAGQQLYICRLDPATQALSWVNANDESNISNSVTAETTRAQAAEATLTTNLANEVSRAQGAEGSLAAGLSTESERAKSAESSETSRATTAENTLTSSLGNEVTRAQNAEGSLTTNLSEESTARQAADAALSSSVVAESQRATAAEASVSASVTAEVTRATAAENSKADLLAPIQAVNNQPTGNCASANAVQLWSAGPAGQQLYICRLDPGTQTLSWVNANDESNISGSVTAETTRAQAAEATLTTNLANEVSRAQAAEGSLTANLSAESERAKNAESSETSRATTAENTLTSNLGNEVTRAQNVEGSLTTNLNAESTARQAADAALSSSVVAEMQRATVAEASVTASVTAETTRATAAENSKADLLAPIQAVNNQPTGNCVTVNAVQLWSAGSAGQQLYICRLDPGTQALAWVNANDESNISGAVATETTRAQAAEATLTTNLANEVSRAQAAESALTTSLSAESERAKSAESSEASRATTAENTLTSNLGSEVTRAQNAEGSLTTNLNAESTARQAADAALSSSVVAESQRATAAEASVSASVTAETTRATTAENSKADIQAPIQAVSSQPSGNCSTVNAMQLWSSGPVGGQLYICRQDPSSHLLTWSNAYDESTLSTSITAETTRAQGAESTLATNLSNEINRAQGAESTLTANLNNEISRAQASESSLSITLATKATAVATTAATNTKITYNAQGIVTGSTQAASTDLSDSSTLLRNGGVTPASGTITISPGSLNSGNCTDASSQESFTGLTSSMVFVITPASSISSNWPALTWMPGFVTGSKVTVRVCNLFSGKANNIPSQTFNIRFIN